MNKLHRSVPTEADRRDAVRAAELGTSFEKYRKTSVLADLTFARDADTALASENEVATGNVKASNKAIFGDALREADAALASSLRKSETDATLSILGAAATRRKYLDARNAHAADGFRAS